MVRLWGGGCLIAFVDVYRTLERRRQRFAPLLDPGQDARPLFAEDPADLVSRHEDLEAALPPPGRARTAVLLAAAGYSHAEIAQILEEHGGHPVTVRAVEGMLHRHRRVAQRRLDSR